VKGRSFEERQRLFQAVHDALMEAFQIPDDDRTQRIVEHEPENFEIPPGSSHPYTLIEITAFPGRSADAKRNLYRTLVQRLGEIAIDPRDVSVVILEPALESWGVRGGHSASPRAPARARPKPDRRAACPRKGTGCASSRKLVRVERHRLKWSASPSLRASTTS
jgi:phenylpyruvate tautomerase PptA (4-oxalocrotonate tautomerase family)